MTLISSALLDKMYLLFSGLEFIEKLAALIVPPRIHLVRFFGCLAPHAKIRSQIVPKKKTDSQLSETPVPESTTSSESNAPPKKKYRIGWAEWMGFVYRPHNLALLQKY